MKTIAIVGTGIAGMSCAAKLSSHFDLTLFEKNKYVGGHTNTVTADENGQQIPIDTGFMVYNETTYPKLTRLFQELNVATKPTSMSFSVQHVESGLEFAGTGYSGLFAQRRRLFSPAYFRFLMEIDRFNKTCSEVLTGPAFQNMTLQQYCKHRRYSDDFQMKYLVPMSAAVWSAPPGKMLEFPALSLVRFFTNHRFLSLTGQLQWRTVVGGSRNYRDKLIAPFAKRIQVGNSVKRVKSVPAGVELLDAAGVWHNFDAVVLACHADEALGLLESPSAQQRSLLSHFKYQFNRATLHTDDGIMPKSKAAWTSWNYRVDPEGASTVYWMNSLQDVSKRKNYFVSINDPGKIRAPHVLKVIDYEHPMYTLESTRAQADLPKLNQDGAIYFCGSYFNYGFHEDGLASGLDAAAAVKNRLL